jgi:hypothetical protein
MMIDLAVAATIRGYLASPEMAEIYGFPPVRQGGLISGGLARLSLRNKWAWETTIRHFKRNERVGFTLCPEVGENCRCIDDECRR